MPISECDPDGLFSGPWWEHGSAKTANASGSFLAEYARQTGPPIDTVIADTEEWMGLLAFESGTGSNDPCTVARLNAVQRDPRFPEILAGLIAMDDAFADVDVAVDDSLHGAMCRQGHRASRCFSSAMAWDAFMLTRAAAAMNTALYHPFRAAFPEIMFSNYMFRRWRLASTTELTPPARNGALFYMHGDGAMNGNLQSHPAYGSMNYLIRNALVATVPGLDTFDHTSPFNAMLYDVNTLRSQKLVPGSADISPWITCKHQEGSPPSTLLYGSAFYDEQVLHLALTGVHSFNAWQPLTSWSEYCNPDFDDNLLISRLLHELNARIGCVSSTSALSIVATLAPWDASFLLSGVARGGIATYRFTSRTALPYPSPVQSGPNVTVAVLPGGGGGQCTLVFVSAVLVPPSGSFTAGVWIAQDVVDGALIVEGTCPPNTTTLLCRVLPGSDARSGCTDQTAVNHDAAANVDDGSCTCAEASDTQPCDAVITPPPVSLTTGTGTVARTAATTVAAAATSVPAGGADDSGSQSSDSDDDASSGATALTAVGVALAVFFGGAAVFVALRWLWQRQPGAGVTVHRRPSASNPVSNPTFGEGVGPDNGDADSAITIWKVRGSVHGPSSGMVGMAPVHQVSMRTEMAAETELC